MVKAVNTNSNILLACKAPTDTEVCPETGSVSGSQFKELESIKMSLHFNTEVLGLRHVGCHANTQQNSASSTKSVFISASNYMKPTVTERE